MHQILLGVVKTFLFNLQQKRLSQRKSEVVSNRLKSIVFPSGFGRKFRPLDLIRYWKASELRNFTFYVLTALQVVIHENLFAPFCLLSLIIRLLAEYFVTKFDSQSAFVYCNLSEKVTSFFTYSAEFYNMHALDHTADQVKTTGPLASICAMGFESAKSQLTLTVSQILNSQTTTDLVMKRNLRKFSVEQRKRNFYCNEIRLSKHINETSESSHLQPSEPFKN